VALTGVESSLGRKTMVEQEIAHCACGVDPALLVAAPVLVFGEGLFSGGEGGDVGEGERGRGAEERGGCGIW
jgi:hypothetical protein